MSKTLRDRLIERLEAYRIEPPEQTQEELRDTYPDISLEDAERVKTGLLSLLDAKDRREQSQREREYKALHAELKRKYKKGGKH